MPKTLIPLYRQLNDLIDEAFETGTPARLLEFAHERMPSFTSGRPSHVHARLTRKTVNAPPSRMMLEQRHVQLEVTREAAIQMRYRGKAVTTREENVDRNYPWFRAMPGEDNRIVDLAVRHVGRGSRLESPWPESDWPQVGGLRFGLQNWPPAEALFGPYDLQLIEGSKQEGDEGKAIYASLSAPNVYGVIPRAVFSVAPDGSVVMALQHENLCEAALSWAPWFVLGFAVALGNAASPSTILVFPDAEHFEDPVETMRGVWNYIEIEEERLALINPQAYTLNEPFKKLYRDTNWALLAIGGEDHVILTRSVLRHEEQFFPFLGQGAGGNETPWARFLPEWLLLQFPELAGTGGFVEIEFTGPRAARGEKSSVIIKHDFLSVFDLTRGQISRLNPHRMEQDVRLVLKHLIPRLRETGTAG